MVDDILPIVLSRTYQDWDRGRRSFGVGSALDFDTRIEMRSRSGYLTMPNGGVVRMERLSPGGTQSHGAYFELADPPAELRGAYLTWVHPHWQLVLPDGNALLFGRQGPVVGLQDRHGNRVSVFRPRTDVRDSGPPTVIYSPHGRWMRFEWDDSGRMLAARDHAGRSVSYAYDESNRLESVADSHGRGIRYRYDDSGRIIKIADGAGALILGIEHENGRVVRQTRPDGSSYEFAYGIDEDGAVVEATVTDPRGIVRRVRFEDSYWVEDTAAVGTEFEQAIQVERDPTSRLITSAVDSAGRQARFRYDERGNLVSATDLSGTPDEATIGYKYEGHHSDLVRLDDHLGHEHSWFRSAVGDVVEAVDPYSGRTRLAWDERGRVTSVEAVSTKATTTIEWEAAHSSTVTDPWGSTFSERFDARGRRASITDAAGNISRYRYDELDQLVEVIDPSGESRSYGYTPAGELESLTDANGNTTHFEYDSMGQLKSRTDASGAAEHFGYDGAGNLIGYIDRRGVITTESSDKCLSRS